ncbi:hypothetical protein BDN70DRAFT_932096 [Pholiota conissans]|uniref:Uncharacterized protein n=1 Tax=Pholiota conissans TaxID=109636 RepID=A0A9P6D186_9AGAR|nr:hypothetical protein BDN70DRAFT_932096 [Pholiota conissans]
MSVPSLASFQGIQANAAPQFVGIFLVWALFGVLSTQTYLYFKTFSNDRIFLKTLVYTVYTLQMAQTILLTRAEWKVFVTGFGDLDSLGEVWAAWIALCVIGGIVTFLVQLFYAYRIYVLSQNAFVSGIITLASQLFDLFH